MPRYLLSRHVIFRRDDELMKREERDSVDLVLVGDMQGQQCLE